MVTQPTKVAASPPSTLSDLRCTAPTTMEAMRAKESAKRGTTCICCEAHRSTTKAKMPATTLDTLRARCTPRGRAEGREAMPSRLSCASPMAFSASSRAFLSLASAPCRSSAGTPPSAAARAVKVSSLASGFCARDGIRTALGRSDAMHAVRTRGVHNGREEVGLETAARGRGPAAGAQGRRARGREAIIAEIVNWQSKLPLSQ
mmetsp:Transcript_53633/g.170575  ORF Transcript_53633/g.170575 Transcript_53633/m.170575 type:complete len:204 (+) Transcript_53633:499-1110(+)